MRLPVLSLGITCVAACGGGGGGPAPAPVTLELATFVGAGPSPAQGDELQLLMSRDVVLVSGAVLDDRDLTLSSGTLGAIQTAPTLISPRQVRITLGQGVSFAPGSTMIAFSTDNDAVRGTGGVLPGTTQRVIKRGDGDLPQVTGLTLNAIDGALNGTGPAGGTLQVPRSGFHIDVSHSDPTSAIDASATVIATNVVVNAGGSLLLPGQSLTPALTVSGGAGTSRFSVPSGVTFGDGAATVTVFAVDVTGMVSAPRSFGFRVRALDDAVRPFERTQLWFLDLSRDLESFVHDPAQTSNPVRIVKGPGGDPVANGRPDLDDLFFVLGLLGGDASVNVTVQGQLRQRLLSELAGLFAGADVSFTLTSPGTFPGSPTVPYGALSFSQICIAGAADESGTSGILGAAIFDPNNTTQDNDCLLQFGGVQRLGVFMHTLVNAGLRPPSVTLFRTTYDPLVPQSGGIPIGDHPDGLDPGRLSGAVVDARAGVITTAIDHMARVIAVVTAHECGHSMGLVRDGKMPAGLYGNDPAFPGSSTGHIRTPALFPPGSQNVMSPSLDFDDAVAAPTGFNSLNLAYLREQAVHNQ